MRHRASLAGAMLLLVALSLASVFVGVGDVFSTSSGSGGHLLLISRIPRTLAALLTGAALAIGGLVMQTLARNRFVEPMTAGTGQSAALGILAITILAPQTSIFVKGIAGSLAAFAGTSVFLILARRLPPEQPFLVPLFGIIYGGIVGALVTGIAWHADMLQFLDIWMNGEFSGVIRGRYELLWITALMVAAAWWVADQLTIMLLGREVSVGLGLNYGAMLQFGLLIVSLTAALTVVTVGAIPFVGLVVPAVISRQYGDDLKSVLPMVATGGAGLVLLSDLIGRLIRFPYEIPVGTVLGVIGAAGFLALIYSRQRNG